MTTLYFVLFLVAIGYLVARQRPLKLGVGTPLPGCPIYAFRA